MSATTRRAVLVTRDLARAFWFPVSVFIAIIVVVFAIAVGVTLAWDLEGRELWGSFWENFSYATRYFPLAIGIALTPVHFPACMANGITRRSFGLGAAGLVVGLAAVIGALEALAYLVEHVLYRIDDLTPHYGTPHLFNVGTEVWISGPEVWLVVAAHVTTGWLIGTAYYRWGLLWPTIALPLLVVPLLTIEALMSVGWAGEVMIERWNLDRQLTLLAFGESLAVLAVLLVGTMFLVRTLAIRMQRT